MRRYMELGGWGVIDLFRKDLYFQYKPEEIFPCCKKAKEDDKKVKRLARVVEVGNAT